MSRVPNRRDHYMYLWLMTEMRTLIDNALAISTQYDWINNEEDKGLIFTLMERDMRKIANHVAKEEQNNAAN